MIPLFKKKKQLASENQDIDIDLIRHEKIKERLDLLGSGFYRIAKKHEQSRGYFRNVSRGIIFTYAAALKIAEETGFRPEELWPEKNWNDYLAKRSLNR